MSSACGKIGILAGVALLLHTGYSVSQHLAFVRYNEEELTSLPLDMILEALIGVAVAVWGAAATKTFKEIRTVEDLASKSYESFLNRPNFLTFNHRGKKLFASFEALSFLESNSHSHLVVCIGGIRKPNFTAHELLHFSEEIKSAILSAMENGPVHC